MSSHAGRIEVVSREQWRSWLEQYHRQTDGVWVVLYKRTSVNRYMPYEELVEEALCFAGSIARVADSMKSD